MSLESIAGFFTLLPMIVFGALLFVIVRTGRSARMAPRPPDKFDQLARLADLRDRGVVTQDEFLREKQKLLES